MRDACLQRRLVAIEIQHAARIAVVVRAVRRRSPRAARAASTSRAGACAACCAAPSRRCIRPGTSATSCTAAGRSKSGIAAPGPCGTATSAESTAPAATTRRTSALARSCRHCPSWSRAPRASCRSSSTTSWPSLQQLIGGGHADHAAAHDQDAHGRLLTRGGDGLKSLRDQMTGHRVAGRRLGGARFLLAADRHDVRAAGVEAAAGRRMQRARNVVGQPLAAAAAARCAGWAAGTAAISACV